MRLAPLPPTADVDWTELVQRIQRGDDSGMEELYRVFAGGVRFFLYRRLGADEIDDKIHDTFLIVVEAIRRGELREPERLMGFVRTVVRRQAAGSIDRIVNMRRDSVDIDDTERIPDQQRSAEDTFAFRQKVDLAKRVLRELPERDREILVRFYLHEQTQERICREMDLSDTQFRLLKSRAKDRFGALGKKRVKQNNLATFCLRNSSGFCD
jgi:RNA polymerase sigma factor (sigma-70 family)